MAEQTPDAPLDGASLEGDREMSREDHEQLAYDWLLNGETAEEVRVVAEEKTGATQTYMLVLDVGWKQSIIASRMYEHDALGTAHAVAAVLDCKVVEHEGVRVS